MRDPGYYGFADACLAPAAREESVSLPGPVGNEEGSEPCTS